MLFASLWRIAYENQYVAHPLQKRFHLVLKIKVFAQ